MTLVHVLLHAPVAEGEAPAVGWLSCTPMQRHHLEDPDRVVVPSAFRVELDELGQVDIVLAAGWYWQIREDVRGGIVRYVLVPDQAEVDYGDLVDIDPTTLDPSTPPSPAWLAMAASTVTTGSVVGDHLILSRTDGTTVDAGPVVGPQGAVGQGGPAGPVGVTAVTIITLEPGLDATAELVDSSTLALAIPRGVPGASIGIDTDGVPYIT